MRLTVLFRPKVITIGAAAILLILFVWWLYPPPNSPHWSVAEVETLRSLSIRSLNPPPASHSNAVADDPRAAKLGRQLFFDVRLSANESIACASCHQPERRFSDGVQKGQALGSSNRNTLSVVGAAYSPWLYWDGRKDSVWSQALAPLEDPNEHGSNRMKLTRLITSDKNYRKAYEILFGQPPNISDLRRFPKNAGPIENSPWYDAWQAMTPADQRIVNTVFSNMGKSIAAYIRLLRPSPSRFDNYIQAVTKNDVEKQRTVFDDDEAKGLQLFIGKANCTQCHNGASLTNHEFHNTGTISFPGETPDKGRVDGVRILTADPFNCLGAYSDDPQRMCAELRFARAGFELIGAFRTPSLRNLDGTAPYMHKGQLATLAEVLDHYNRAPLAMIGHNETSPLELNRRELMQLEKFLNTLTAPVTTPIR